MDKSINMTRIVFLAIVAAMVGAAELTGQSEIIFPEINIDSIDRIQGMNITFVTSANTDEEGYALLKAFGLPFKNAKNDK